jgi:hypothetical protein
VPIIKNTELDEMEIRKRRAPCLVTYLTPFRFIESNLLAPWKVDLNQINSRNWDYVALHEMAGGIDVGLKPPYHLVVSRDGALALPAVDALASLEGAVDYFNKCLSAILLGGVYCEAISPDSIDAGSIIDWKYIRVFGSGKAAANIFHQHIRSRQSAPLEAIALLEPRAISLRSLDEAMKYGLTVLDRIKPLRGAYLLKGVTGYARRDWGTSLINLWIAIEQLISHLWQVRIVLPTLSVDATKSRRGQLNDTRTWTASARVELLYQVQTITNSTLAKITTARLARNHLTHEGTPPNEADAQAAHSAIVDLLTIALDGECPPFHKLDLKNHTVTDPLLPPPERTIAEPKYWMEILRLPGELELEKAEFELRKKNSQKSANSGP